jgi:hypothetical protein
LPPPVEKAQYQRRETMPTTTEIVQKIEAMWTDPAERKRVLAELQKYGMETYEREPERVRLAILKLSEARMERVIELVTTAKQDYSDVLMWAEYPGEGQALWALRPDLPKEEQSRLEELRQQDRQQYQDWIKK